MASRTAGWALVVWCAVFAVPHVYWASGGRSGLGADTAAADAAFATPWFAAYNALTVVACLAGAALGLTDLSGRTHLAARFRRALLVLAALLAVRGLVGVVGLALGVAAGGPWPPLILVAVEPWFLLGAVVLVGVARSARPPT